MACYDIEGFYCLESSEEASSYMGSLVYLRYLLELIKLLSKEVEEQKYHPS